MTDHQITLFGDTVVLAAICGAAGATAGSIITQSPLGAELFTIGLTIGLLIVLLGIVLRRRTGVRFPVSCENCGDYVLSADETTIGKEASVFCSEKCVMAWAKTAVDQPLHR